jgi:hypothetical protein
VVNFPRGFWERFDAATEEMQAHALDSIRLSVALQYRAPAREDGPAMAHVVDAHMSYLNEA